jgi:type III restriction enzyme
LTNKLIVDAEYSDYDKINLDFAKKGHEEDYEISRNDVEKLFNWYCFQLLSEQTDKEAKVSNISRSWSPLKSAFRVWLKRSFDQDSDRYYRILINDLNKDRSSVFREALTTTLKKYYPVKMKFLEERKKDIEKREASIFEIKEEYTFTEDYAEPTEEEGTSNLSAIQPFYLKKEYTGRINELKFLNFLEQKKNKIEWWFKNGDIGKEYYCLRYFNTGTKEEALFYPDWIIKFKDGRIGIFDTKSGQTAQNPEGRAEGLADKIKELNTNGGKYVGGLVIPENNQWYYFNNEKYLLDETVHKSKESKTEYAVGFDYEYTPGKLTENWKLLSELFT